jgi:hypothetical protein
MRRTEKNYVLMVTLICGTCHESEPVPFDMGKPKVQLSFPVTRTVEFI